MSKNRFFEREQERIDIFSLRNNAVRLCYPHFNHSVPECSVCVECEDCEEKKKAFDESGYCGDI